MPRVGGRAGVSSPSPERPLDQKAHVQMSEQHLASLRLGPLLFKVGRVVLGPSRAATGIEKAKEGKGAPCQPLWALNAHCRCSGRSFYYSTFSSSPRDPWQDLINQEIKVAFAKARQSTARPWSSGKALAGL